MSIAAGTGRLGRSSRAGSSRPGVVGRAISAGGRIARGLSRGRGRGAMGRARRARGITARELRGFRKVTRLLRSVGMRPKGLGGHRRK
jgi:hypothetical protein